MTPIAAVDAFIRKVERKSTRRQGDEAQRILAAVGFAFFEIAVDPTHLIGDMRKAQHRLVARLREGIERRRFHFDSEQLLLAHGIDGPLRFTKWRVCRPGGPVSTGTENRRTHLSAQSSSAGRHGNRCDGGI